MQIAQKIGLMNTSLERAAEQLGDITGPVMRCFYAHHPDARAVFEAHSSGDGARLEADMVESVLYCLMTWLERPSEISIMLAQSVPHHLETLHVTPAWFHGLAMTTSAVIAATIPDDCRSERAVWSEITNGLDAAIADARPVAIAAGAK